MRGLVGTIQSVSCTREIGLQDAEHTCGFGLMHACCWRDSCAEQRGSRMLHVSKVMVSLTFGRSIVSILPEYTSSIDARAQ